MLKLSSEITVNVAFPIQCTHKELTSSHKQRSLSHKKDKTFSSKVMALSYQQKHSWMCKSVCLVSFRCLLTVSYSVQLLGVQSPQAHQAPHCWDTALCCTLQWWTVCTVCFCFHQMHHKNFFTCSDCEMEFTW